MIIVDASLANKLFLPNELNYTKVDALFEKHDLGLEEILIPDLLIYEVANTLATKTQIPSATMTWALTKLYKLNMQIINISEKQIKLIAKFAKKYKVSVYDATYAVLAKEKKCNLITADSKFVSQVKLSFVKDLANYS